MSLIEMKSLSLVVFEIVSYMPITEMKSLSVVVFEIFAKIAF